MTLPLLLMLVWTYVPTNGPVYFEIWSSTNLVNWVLKTNVPFSPWAFQPAKVAEFFMLRAHKAGSTNWPELVSDWATE